VLSGAGLPTTIALTALVGLTLGSFGPVAAYLTEVFPAPIRATGFGVGYSLALALPAFYVFYLAALGDVVPPHVAPSWWLPSAAYSSASGATSDQRHATWR
jgi:hypothetical protein